MFVQPLTRLSQILPEVGSAESEYERSTEARMSTAVQKLEVNSAEPIIPAPTPIPAPPAQDPLDTMPWLPCTLSLELPVVRFTISDLLALTQGSIVETASHHTSDVPLRVNQLLIGWTEFEVIGDQLAVRITEQA
jgi:flagellar motor switch/type III secretory pathway protein FliN